MRYCLSSFCCPRLAAAQLRDRTEHPRADEGQPQSSKKPAKRGPRAIGVIEFLPKGGARLVPIALWMDGRYYDASFYGANPEPMALQPETLYQATELRRAHWMVHRDHARAGQRELGCRRHMEAAKCARHEACRASRQAAEEEGVISDKRRFGPAGAAPFAHPAARPGVRTSSSLGNQRSSMRPSPSGRHPHAASSASAQHILRRPSTDDDPDRPTLKNSTPSSSTTSSRPTLGPDTSQANAQPPSPPASSPDENDPDRPVLHRGKPTAQPNTSAAATTAPKPNASKISHAPTPPSH